MIEGKQVSLGGENYTIAPLSFKQLRTLQPKFEELSKMQDVPTVEQMDAVIEIVHAALSRNYPEITKEEVEDGLDLGNLRPVMGALMGVSGLLGEAKAGSQ